MLRVLKAVEQDEGGAEGKGGVGRAGLGVSLGTPSVAGTSQSVLNNGGGGWWLGDAKGLHDLRTQTPCRHQNGITPS